MKKILIPILLLLSLNTNAEALLMGTSGGTLTNYSEAISMSETRSKSIKLRTLSITHQPVDTWINNNNISLTNKIIESGKQKTEERNKKHFTVENIHSKTTTIGDILVLTVEADIKIHNR